MLLLVAGELSAAENAGVIAQSTPNVELLEFLGSFATDEGEWIDPNSLLDDELSALLDAYTDQAETDTQQTDDMASQDADND